MLIPGLFLFNLLLVSFLLFFLCLSLESDGVDLPLEVLLLSWSMSDNFLTVGFLRLLFGFFGLDWGVDGSGVLAV